MIAQEISYADTGYAKQALYDRTTILAAQADIVDQIDRVSRALYLPFKASCPEAPLAERIDRIFARDRGHADLLRRAVCSDAQRGPRLSAIAGDPRLIEAAQRICGRALAGSIVRVRASVASFPEHRHAWHSDVVRDDDTACGRVWITAWIPLSDAGPGCGGLEIVPGRHAAPLAQATGRGFEIPEAAIAGMERIQPECAAGEVIFLDRFTPHRTLPTVDARFALVVWMMAA